MMRHDVQGMLHFGYVPHAPSADVVDTWSRLLAVDRAQELPQDRRALVEVGVARLVAAFDATDTGLHVVPLSGGLDSRAVLGGLLRRSLGDRLVTVTLGLPGSYDFEIGRRVARAVGVRHEAIDLGTVSLRTDPLTETTRAVGTGLWIFGAHYLRHVHEHFGRDATFWSGFLGDPLTGSHLLARDSPDWDTAVHSFVVRGRMTAHALTAPDFRPRTAFPTEAPLAKSRLTFDEQVDFLWRQEAYVRPTVLPRGFDVRTPFLDHGWVDFATALPRALRWKQTLYREVLDAAFPKLFALPTKNELGLPPDASRWRRSVRRLGVGLRGKLLRAVPVLDGMIDPRENYLDWGRAIRRREDLRETVREAMESLGRREVVPGVDPRSILRQHLARRGDRGAELTLLTSLELWLRTEEMRHADDG